MAVVISLKLVYTPVDDNVTAPHKSQVTSHVIEDQGGSDRRDLSVSQIELRLSRVSRPVERRDIGPSLAFRQNTPTTSKLQLSRKMYGGQQGSNVSFMVFIWLHATVMTRTRYIDN